MSAVPDEQESPRTEGTVTPLLPLTLLEAVREHDRPRELLEDEDLSISLPRRLGLTGAVESQIRRYTEAERRRRGVPAEEVRSLLQLVLRRPDAEAILRRTGQAIARTHVARTPAAALAALRALPSQAVQAAAARAVRRLLRRLVGNGRVDAAGRPPVVRITGGLALQADPGGTACALYTGAIEELFRLYTRAPAEARQVRCSARGGDCCEWTVTGG